MITISTISVIMFIFINHTILTHLLNWLFRESMDSPEGIAGAMFVNMLEISIIFITLKFIL
jgi:hypothetical protein